MIYTYDPEADALYVYIQQGQKVAKSIELDDDRVVDLDDTDYVVGIEVLGASHGFKVIDLIDRFGLQAHRRYLESVEKAHFQSLEFA